MRKKMPKRGDNNNTEKKRKQIEFLWLEIAFKLIKL